MAKEINWTKQQLLAIKQRGSDILVSASAGTGKTAVLSRRCVDILSEGSAETTVLGMLVLTFTNAAAEQMRRRIAQQLQDAIMQSKDRNLNKRLRQQLVFLPATDIGTIHSFCKRLITRYFYKLGIDPTFTVIEADEQRLLKAEILEDTIDWAWQQDNLRQGLQILLDRRDLRTDDGFLSAVLEISDYLDGVISRDNWYERAFKIAEILNPHTGRLGEKQKEIIRDKLRRIIQQLNFTRQLCKKENPDSKWPDKLQTDFVEYIEDCQKLLEQGDLNSFAGKIRIFEKPILRKPSDLDETIAELLKKTAGMAIKGFLALADYAVVNPDYLNIVSGAADLQTKVLVELVKQFDNLYHQAKARINCMDFADLEHYALKLLVADGLLGEENIMPSREANELREKYKFIFVDEYQDINYVQKAIIDLLSSGGNVFVVGDVKQSIYAFRGAEPKIFVRNLADAATSPDIAAKGLRVDLNASFRSDKGILDFVNKIFSRIMKPALGDVDYDESAKLQPAAEKSQQGPFVELHILDKEDTADDDTEEANGENKEETDLYSIRQRQAAIIAQRIRRMVGLETGKAEFQIFDKSLDGFRDVRYGDIVVLMRSLAKKADEYVEIFQLAGIPVSCGAATGYFEKTEIRDMICLLQVLDNPIRDIELAAVLRSPMFNVTDTELACLKIHGPKDLQKQRFYDYLLEYCRTGTDKALAGKLKNILSTLEKWRTIARNAGVADLIWHIYRQTNYLAFVLALPNGSQRKANLLKLHQRAIQFEQFAGSAGLASLTRFVEFIERLQQSGDTWGSAEPQSHADNSARIMSIHKSKGLEFPVVFLAELDSQFNKDDLKRDFLVDSQYTLGLKIIDRKTNTKLDTLAHQVIAEEKRSTLLAEEMRILYVAMTRAGSRLILSGCRKGGTCAGIISKGIFFGNTVPDWQLRACNNHLDWILYALADEKILHSTVGTQFADRAVGDNLFDFQLYNQSQLQQLDAFIGELRKSRFAKTEKAKIGAKKGSSQLFSRIKKSFDWRYEFADVASLPAKRSVTQLTHRADEFAKIDYSASLERKPKTISVEGAIDSRLIGTAVHLVMANLDLGKPVTQEEVEKIKVKLVADGKITQLIAEQINTKSVIAFFNTEPGKAVSDAKNIYREWPFTFVASASAINTHNAVRTTHDETIVVQGIIDLLAVTKDGLILVDFKTDHISEKQVVERSEQYRQQLDLYGKAAEAILKTKLTGKWLYFFKPEAAYSL